MATIIPDDSFQTNNKLFMIVNPKRRVNWNFG